LNTNLVEVSTDALRSIHRL
ncbi:hypothetical protein D047_3566B, partial [Vibrio parahaemolyticus VPTS-2010_2]